MVSHRDPLKTRRVNLRIRGKVQGVSYRYSALLEAQRLDLRGFVRNLQNGDVEAVAEGTPESVDRFVTWCRQGPPSARVSEVAVEELTAGRPLEPFHVEHGTA